MCVMREQISSHRISKAIDALREGWIIAYPTESCFGLGCDPKNRNAIQWLIKLKSRSTRKGLILIAASIEQAKEYVQFTSVSKVKEEEIYASWPGPNTWLLPPTDQVLTDLRGDFPLLAIRVTAHPIAKKICEDFGGAIVSTSANLSGKTALMDESSVLNQFPQGITIVSGDIGKDTKPSTIRDGLTGKILRQ